ncbi:hypothetical protein M514_02476 [Trichuris suis]|uniref:Uncharacterized protein n=1 Tax=Trichuris suis TaxID=68888 RepID=A0A085NF99_9BILA|nr:hypothetical protein M513_02476 [Trichuris suis]KFD68145.1 hypothetical protein M514_02476 [Trichuris suis]
MNKLINFQQHKSWMTLLLIQCLEPSCRVTLCARDSCTSTPVSAGKIRPWERGRKNDMGARTRQRRESTTSGSA